MSSKHAHSVKNNPIHHNRLFYFLHEKSLIIGFLKPGSVSKIILIHWSPPKNSSASSPVHKVGIYSLRGRICTEFEANWGDPPEWRAPARAAFAPLQKRVRVYPIYHERSTFLLSCMKSKKVECIFFWWVHENIKKIFMHWLSDVSSLAFYTPWPKFSTIITANWVNKVDLL